VIPLPPELEERLHAFKANVKAQAKFLLLGLAALWAFTAFFALLQSLTPLGNPAEVLGVRRLQLKTLLGIPLAPVLGAWKTMASVSIPLFVLAWTILSTGRRTLAHVTLIIVLGGGLATWLLAPGGPHTGPSGLVFGYLAFVLSSAWLDRNPLWVTIGTVTGILYLLSAPAAAAPGLPSPWALNLFGLLAGAAATFWLRFQHLRLPRPNAAPKRQPRPQATRFRPSAQRGEPVIEVESIEVEPSTQRDEPP